MPVIETLGGALFGAVLQLLFDRPDSHHVFDYFRRRKLNEKLLYKLKVKLLSINNVIDDAEQKQFSNSYVKAWLDEVKDAVFDAEDLLDEIDYEFCKCKLKAESHTRSKKVWKFFKPSSKSFLDKKIESRMEQVLEQIEFLSSQKGDLGLEYVSCVGVGPESVSKVTQKLPSTSLVVESVVYGREDEKEMILNWLSSDTDNHSQPAVLSIVAMGGMGKTTLAQHVYNDPRIEEAKFDLKAWVCVSDEYDAFKVAREILQAINNSIDDSRNLEMVQVRLKEKLTGKKFLFVLDDVWNEDRDRWKPLQTPLKYGAKGSKILVTTRSSKVATTVQSHKVHELKQLEEDHSWQVFAKHAFQDNNYHLNVEVEKIGKKIVEKCKGLPLALETIGCLLHTKSSVSEWESVLISKIWDLPREDSKIIPALLLSYYHLPSHLKRCFAYCALFPKDQEFHKESLILLWMAENFLQCSQQGRSPEVVGEQYFDELLSRSFFQKLIQDNKTYFVMHDLLNDLAKYVCGDICFRFGVDEEKKTLVKTRHLSLVTNEDQYSDGFRSLYDAKGLRTIMPTSRRINIDYYWDCKMSMNELFSKFKFLRVLSLSCCRGLKEVPGLVGDLKHLRSLDLSGTLIEKLPDSICSLYNLQILKLNSCFNLKVLPSNLHKLTNLRCLELMKTNVIKMPVNIGKLNNLQVLMSSFRVGESSEFTIQQLGDLSLRGGLTIEDLQNILNPLDAVAADLKSKRNLVELTLKWNHSWNLADLIKEREVLENLQPSKHLEKLSIWNYGGIQFPSWLANTSLSFMVSLSLENCNFCTRLPPLGLFPYLKDLTISGMGEVVSINADFFGSTSSSFSSLETLKFSFMYGWENWECQAVTVTDAFPRLQHLSIRHCPKLKGDLPEKLLQLRKLLICECKELVASAPVAQEIFELDLQDCGKLQFDYHPTSLKRLTVTGDSSMQLSLDFLSKSKTNIPVSCYDFLETLDINDGCDSLMSISLDCFPKLLRLCLKYCHNLHTISQGRIHNHLKDLQIIACPQFQSFPDEGLSAPMLESFAMKRLPKLKSLPQHMHILLPSLTSLLIHDCPQMKILSDEGLPSNLENMNISNCSRLVASLKGPLGANTSLQTLSVQEVDVESFPSEGFLPISLTCLIIRDCPHLKTLNYKGLCNPSSLKKLTLFDCPNIRCLPEEGLPKSISTFRILGNCPLLKESSQKPQGQD
ncbi:putative disease resistance RPP13-like protein 1 [Vigna radiata var. radiata]|uniref:Disease resistance RPP13-like protein 1 n=1 Tax=Vigna radiata var. radiata TaxID=3916 RepID=A0A3Q0FFY3_VIGRR|nr:putative disease resistance RPP13-like protein 1 [Vigna radiata var. radiata]